MEIDFSYNRVHSIGAIYNAAGEQGKGELIYLCINHFHHFRRPSLGV